VFITFICFDVLTHQKIFEHDDVSWQRPQYHPHQSPTPTNYSALKYTSPTRECDNMKVRNVLQHHRLHYFPNSPVFLVISQVSTAPITMPPTLTLRPTRGLGSPIYYLNVWRMKYGGEKSIATLSFLVLCKLTSFVFPLNSHSHE
jgi:hypothetical protein